MRPCASGTSFSLILGPTQGTLTDAPSPLISLVGPASVSPAVALACAPLPHPRLSPLLHQAAFPTTKPTFRPPLNSPRVNTLSHA